MGFAFWARRTYTLEVRAWVCLRRLRSLAAFFLRSTRRQPKRAGSNFVLSSFPIPILRMVNSRISFFMLRRQFSAQRGIPIQQTQRDLLRLALPKRNVSLTIRV